ncbi:MAG: hypothetical protein XXXJIFNMEKO3_00813 [Candidatus Erwinia impunctatus]|nr:hypothetical protein XXXJIFNMEKO_00813 [Culicoides impunctatus]
MPPKNLSEELFKPRFKHPETSSLVRRLPHRTPLSLQSVLAGVSHIGWYRMINRLLWHWRGMSLIEIEEILARIASSSVEHTDDRLLDTVIGYRGGNWAYEWSTQAAGWQSKAVEESIDAVAGQHWLHVANLYGIASYPHLKGDALADQAQLLANRAYHEATLRLPGELRELTFAMHGGAPVNAFLHIPAGNVCAPHPTVLVCGSLDSLRTDYYRLFHDYLSPRGIAMLTLDMPSVGSSAKWTLNQDTSILHQQVLRQLVTVPWIDHTRVALFAVRFGANVAVRLAYLEPQRLKAVACLGPVVHALFSDSQLQNQVPEMYMDVLASRIGMPNGSDSALRSELNRYSLEMQGLLGRRTSVPLLSAYWENDVFSPQEESVLITRSSTDGKLMPVATTPAKQGFDRALKESIEWLAGRL